MPWARMPSTRCAEATQICSRAIGSQTLLRATMRCASAIAAMRTAGSSAVFASSSARSVAGSFQFIRFGVGRLRLSKYSEKPSVAVTLGVGHDEGVVFLRRQLPPAHRRVPELDPHLDPHPAQVGLDRLQVGAADLGVDGVDQEAGALAVL